MPFKVKVRQILVTFFQSLGLFALMLLFLIILHPTMYAGNHVLKSEELVSPAAAEVASAVLVFIGICALANSLVYLSPFRKARFLEADPDRTVWRMSKRILYVLKDTAFWLENLALFLLILILPERPLFGPLLNTLGVIDFEKLIVLAFYPLVLVLLLLSHIMAMNRWTVEKNPYVYPERSYFLTFLKDVGIKLAALLALAFGMPLVLGVLGLFWGTLVAVVSDVGALILVGILVFIICTFRLFRGIRRRRIFLRNLKRVCKECHFTYRTERVFRSLVFSHPGPNVWLDTGGKQYEIKLLSSLNRYNAVYLEDSGEAQIIHRFYLFKLELLRYTVAVDYTWETGAEKILIVLPVPLNVYAKAGNEDRPLDVGDRIGRYRFFTGTAFLKTLERNLIDRDSWN